MRIEIKDPHQIIDQDFITWFKKQIRDRLLDDIDSKKLQKWTNYFNTKSMYKSIYRKMILAEDIISAGVYNLQHSRSGSIISIYINPNIYAPGLDRIKLVTLCKLINFGNQEIKGYAIFTSTFKHFSENINDYIDMYLIDAKSR